MLQSMGPQRAGHDGATQLNRPLLEDKTNILRFSSTPRSYSPGHLLVDQEKKPLSKPHPLLAASVSWSQNTDSKGGDFEEDRWASSTLG